MGLEFTGEMIEDVLGYMQGAFSDLAPLILVVVGLGLGLWVVGGVISAFRAKE